MRPGVLALVVLALVAACSSLVRPSASRDMLDAGGPPADRPLRVFLTGNMGGFVGPCGCETGQSGGLARRAAYLRSVRRGGDLTVELGNVVTGDGLAHKLALRYALEAFAKLRYDVFVPAEGEIRLGKEFEDAAGGLRVVCANLRRSGDGSRVHEPWHLHPLEDGRTVAVVGVAEPFAGVPPDYRIDPIEDAVREAVAELRGRADAVIVAGGLRSPTALALAPTLRGVALLAAGWPTKGSAAAVPTEGAPVMLAGEFGWYVARVEFDANFGIAESRRAWLDDAVPDDPEIAGLVARYKAEASTEGAGFAEKLVASYRFQSYVGSESCAECHAEEFATWRASGHAHAMQTLDAKREARNPECVVCHLGDVPRDPAARPDTLSLGLGCETCHGGGARHAELAKRGSELSRQALAPATRDACLRCHSPPNDTHFEFEKAWSKIVHGPARPR